MEQQRVLIVDDMEDLAACTAALLEIAGYEVFAETSGDAGLKTAEAERPGAILLDLSLPGISGYEVCRRVRAAPGFASGSMRAEDCVNAGALGLSARMRVVLAQPLL